MSRQFSITLSDDVSVYIERIVRPDASSDRDLEAGSRVVAAYTDRVREALAWIESWPGDALP